MSGSANATKSAAVATWWLRSNTFSVGTGVGVGCGNGVGVDVGCGNRVGVRSTSTALEGVNVGISSGLFVGFGFLFAAGGLVGRGFETALGS